MYPSWTCRTILPMAFLVIRWWKGIHHVYLVYLNRRSYSSNEPYLYLSWYYLERPSDLYVVLHSQHQKQSFESTSMFWLFYDNILILHRQVYFNLTFTDLVYFIMNTQTGPDLQPLIILLCMFAAYIYPHYSL